MNSHKIAVVNPDVVGDLRAKIENTASKYGYTVDFYNTPADADGKLTDVEVIYSFAATLAKQAPELKWFHACSAGVDALLAPGNLPNEECICSNSSGAYGTAVAEHGLTLLMMMLRNIPAYMEIVRNHKWDRTLPMSTVQDSRITVLGAGDIGRNFAKRIKGFDPACIIGITRSGRPDPSGYFDEVLPQDRLEEVLPKTDILFMALPGTAATKGIMNKKTLSLLPKNALIVNVGRGNAIVQADLIEALNNGTIAAAALDVFEKEPLPADDPAWNTPNLLVTPHCAGNFTLGYTLQTNVNMFCEELVNYCEGKPMKYLVDRVHGY